MENFIFGLHPVNEAIKSGKEIDKVLVKKNLTGNIALKLVSEIRQQGITIQYVPQEKLDKICKHNHQGIIAYVSPIKYQNLEEVIIKIQDENKTPLIIILDGVTDVRNFGAIARSCECAGASAIVIPTSGSVRISDEAIKTSAGALYNIPICKVENLIDAVLLLNQMNIEVVAVTEKAERFNLRTRPNNSLCFNFRCRRQRNFKLSYKTSRQKSQNSIIWKNIFFKCFSVCGFGSLRSYTTKNEFS